MILSFIIGFILGAGLILFLLRRDAEKNCPKTDVRTHGQGLGKVLHDVRRPLSIARAMIRCLQHEKSLDGVKRVLEEGLPEFESAAAEVEKILSLESKKVSPSLPIKHSLVQSPQRSTKPIVLVVDDNVYMFEDWKNHFQGFHFLRVDIPQSLDELVGRIALMQFDYLLLDYFFDHRNFKGTDVLFELKRRGPIPYKVFLVSNADLEFNESFKKLGFANVVGKDPTLFSF